MNVFNDTEGISRANVSAVLLFDLKSVKLAVKVSNRSPGMREFDIVRFQGIVDTCNFQKGFFGNFLIRATAPLIKKYSNYQLVCPVPKGFLYAANIPPIDIKALPQFLLTNEEKCTDFELSYLIKGKVAKKLEHIWSGRLIGSLILP
jgi:Protein of unknown function (DUF1091)